MFQQSARFSDGKLPVFAFPSSLSFYSDDHASHKQIITLYNPYDFSLKFKVFCTSPRKYTVVDAEGTVKKRCCVDIVIRHMDITINNEGVTDKFRIEIYEQDRRTSAGHKDVSCVLKPKKDNSTQHEDTFLSLPGKTSTGSRGSQIQTPSSVTNEVQSRKAGTPGVVVIVTALVSIVALMLPLQGDTNTQIPDYLHLSMNMKLIAAYILGLVTMVILHI